MSPAGQLADLVSRFGPPLALMGVIFVLSAQPNLGTDLGTIDLVGRKLVHMLEYGLLWLLWHRALGWRHAWAAAAITIGYAATDELHQTLVDGRQGTPRDVAIDALGVLIAALLVRRFRSGSPSVRSHDREARTGGTGERSGGLTDGEAPGN
ncbi:MAG TPA: VanZ family protein [Conexibacter sp.]|nr:VanZ family protein [Conexibacter sp.]